MILILLNKFRRYNIVSRALICKCKHFHKFPTVPPTLYVTLHISIVDDHSVITLPIFPLIDVFIN